MKYPDIFNAVASLFAGIYQGDNNTIPVSPAKTTKLQRYKAWLNNTPEGRIKRREMLLKHQRKSFRKLNQY